MGDEGVPQVAPSESIVNLTIITIYFRGWEIKKQLCTVMGWNKNNIRPLAVVAPPAVCKSHGNDHHPSSKSRYVNSDIRHLEAELFLLP